MDGVSPRCPLVPFQVSRGGPFVSPQGHLFTVAGTLWALVFHVRSSIRLVACGPPLTGVGGRPGIIADLLDSNAESAHFRDSCAKKIIFHLLESDLFS